VVTYGKRTSPPWRGGRGPLREVLAIGGRVMAPNINDIAAAIKRLR
jgi:hypothetical protein